ncbi:MAG: ABC transporter substrate-binding protein [Flavobacteriales bacterium]|nr:ABC transporter substrate-binding protein [Flavobacteriales bacterium]
MRKLIIITFACLLFCTQILLAQETQVAKSDSTAKIEGEVYIIHKVEPKQTLFSIAKTYEVKLSRIAFDNTGVLDGLKLGQYLKILESAVGETREENKETEKLELDGEYVLYTVPPRQTLYAISKEYNTTIEAIVDANPELADGLKVGMSIRIPVPKMLGEKHVGKVEMVGLPDIIKQQVVTQTEAQSPVSVASKGGKIALMLPLYLDENDTIATHRVEGEPEKVFERSEIGLAFYEGFLMALDSLNNVGYEVEVSVFDTENRPWKVQQFIKQGKLKGFDLIIGPLYGKVFSEVADFAYQNCIPVVTPTLKGNSSMNGNDFVLRLIPSEPAMISAMGRYLALSDSTENLIVHYGAANELDLIKQFKSGVSSLGMKTAKFREMNINKAGSDSVRNALSITGRNNLILLSENEVRLASLLRKMSNWLEDAYLVGFAPNSWQGFKNIEMDYFDKFRIHVPTPFHVDYERLDVQFFVKGFREKFKTEPSTFAFRGYDLAMHLVRNLAGIREYGPSYLESVQETGLQNDFAWKRAPNGGLENAAPRMVDYTNYELKLATD